MTKPCRMLLVVVAWFLLFSFGIASGQIDHRVNRGDTMGTGRALDQNPGFGTGRINQLGTTFDYGSRAGAIVSGNYTGLARFHDTSPVLYSNQYRLSLPSAGLSGFQSRSVGVQELRPNRIPSPTFYFGTQETVADLGYIRRGLNAPGSSKLISTNTAPPRPAVSALSAQWPTISDPADRRVGISRETSGFGGGQSGTALGVTEDPLTAVMSPFGLAAGSSIFGAPTPSAPVSIDPLSDQSQMDGRLGLHMLMRDRMTSGEEAERDQTWPTDTGRLSDDTATESRLQRDLNAPASQEPVLARMRQQRGGGSAGDETTATAGQRPADLGADRFADMYRVVQEVEKLGPVQLGFQIGEAETFAAGSEADREAVEVPARLRGGLRRSDKAVEELATAARWAKDVLEDPVTTFVGRYENRFNGNMAAAEAALKACEYYNAARLYDLAHTIDPRSPLPLLGRGHALVAAGDYVTAVWLIQKGLQRFPQIAVFRLDLVSLTGQQDVFDIRRADLEDKLARSEDYELRFLLGYLELYSGLPEEGLRDLERAAKSAPSQSVISMFPDLVLGRCALPPLR